MITVRSASSSDIEILATYNEAMALETEHKVLEPALIRNGVRRLLDQPAFGFYLIAEIENQPVGALMVTSEWSDWRDGLFWWVQSVYVTPEHRQRGVFRTLYRSVLERAKADSNICGIRLYVEKENLTAQQVYIRSGMEETPYRLFEVEFARVKNNEYTE